MTRMRALGLSALAALALLAAACGSSSTKTNPGAPAGNTPATTVAPTSTTGHSSGWG
jgi:hypothetical protein